MFDKYLYAKMILCDAPSSGLSAPNQLGLIKQGGKTVGIKIGDGKTDWRDIESLYYTKQEIDVLIGDAAKIVVDAKLSTTSKNPVQNKIISAELEKKLSSEGISQSYNPENAGVGISLGGGLELSSAQEEGHIKIRGQQGGAIEIDIDAKSIAGIQYNDIITTAHKGTSNGVAELDNNGKIISTQLPSYVDDVIEGYYVLEEDNFYADTSHSQIIPVDGGKIYVDLYENKTYRYSGTQYTEISPSIALGETSTTAYRGDRGKIAYEHSKSSGNPHGTTKDDIGLSNVENKSSATIRGEITKANVTDALGYTPASSADIVNNDYVTAGQKAGTILGNHATAEGTDTTASAHETHAEGKNTQALGQASHAEGHNTVAGDAMAHAEGYYSKATGYASHAQGMHTKATAPASSASGYRTEANSSRQFVVGTLNKNSSSNAFEVGRGVPYFNDITEPDPVDLVPEKSFPFNGFEVGVFGQARAESFATKDSVLNNDFSLYDESKSPKTVLGTIVTGTQSIGIGGQRYDKGPDDLQDDPQALVEGNQAIAVGGSNIVHGHWSGSFGKNNENFQCAGFTFGGGNTAGIPEANWKTEEYPYEATDTKEYSKTYSFAFASGESNHAYGRASVAMGRANNTYGLRSIGLGNQNTAKGEASIAIGFGNTSTGKGSVAAGLYATASGDGSHAEGNSTAAAATGAHAEGNSTAAVGNHTHAEGYQTTAKGTQAHAEGFSTNKYVAPSTENVNNIISLWGSTKFALAYGSNSHTEGKDTLALSGNAHAEGDGSIAQGASAHAQGYRTKAQGSYSHAEGNQSVAMGSQSHAQGYKSQAIGDNSYASGIASYANSKTSFAHGDHVTADAESQVVFGKYNAIDSNALLIVGNGNSSTKKNAFVVKNDSITIGNTTLTETQLIKILNFIESIEG